MPLVNPKRSLYIAGQGEVLLDEKDVVQVTRPEIILLSQLHEFAAKHQVNIFCKRCEKAITGGNNASSPYLSVSCQCREWRYVP